MKSKKPTGKKAASKSATATPEKPKHQMTPANEKLFPAMAKAPDASSNMMVARVISIMHAEARRLPDQMWPHTCSIGTTHRFT